MLDIIDFNPSLIFVGNHEGGADLGREVRKLMGENLKVALAEFSTLS